MDEFTLFQYAFDYSLSPRLKAVAIWLALAVASLAIGVWLIGWVYTTALLLSTAFHELGHMWAMERRGMKRPLFYFVPLVGGVAMSKTAMRMRDAPFIAIMGPLAGMLSAPLYGMAAYSMSGSRDQAICATAFAIGFNMVNLLPVMPLDGGRILEAVASSFGRSAMTALLVTGLAIGGYALWEQFDLILFGILTLGLILSLSNIIRRKQDGAAMTKRRAFAWFTAYLGTILLGACLMIGLAVMYRL